MPSRLKRFHHSRQTHFVSFCCYRRRTLFLSEASKATFESALERVRRSFELCIYGYAIMPEHVHLLLSEPGRETLDVAIKSLKQGVSRRLIGDGEHFWQKRYYDFNIRNGRCSAAPLKPTAGLNGPPIRSRLTASHTGILTRRGENPFVQRRTHRQAFGKIIYPH